MISWLTKRAQIFKQRTEYRLLQKTQKGDKDAFGKLYLHYLDSMYRYIFFRVNQQQEIAEDLTQTVFTKAWQHIATFHPKKGNFRAWLYKIAHNTIVDYYKTQKVHSHIVEEIVSDETVADIEKKIDHEQTMTTVLEAMNLLSDEQKIVISLKFIEGFSNGEIADITDKNEDAVRAIQYRGLQTLRKVLQKHA